jgi:dolichyl-phosphate-mannose--protein O-mannosyl transferase
MKSLLNHERPWAYRSVLLVTLLTLAAGLWARVYDLGFPNKEVWDEIYFPVMANKYLQDVYFFDLHPPLGKFIIAVSIALFGNEPVAWRLMPALFGLALLPLVFFLGRALFGGRVGALLLTAFFAGETIMIVHSRIGVMDIFLVFFTLATFLAALRAEGRGQALWTAVLFGVAISIKWAAAPVVIPVGYVLWRKGLLRPFLGGLWIAAVIYVAIVYVERLIILTSNPVQAWVEVWSWHMSAFRKIGAAVPHLWGSPWWSWPIMLRPIRYFYGANPDGTLQTIIAIGNPLVWWSSTLAVLAGLIDAARRAVARKLPADDPLVPIALGYVFLMLPWLPGTRIPYIYNYLVPYSFAILALVYWLCRIWDRPRWGPWVVVGFAALALAVTLFFLPLATALPLSEDALMRRVWIDYWFYQEMPVPGSGCYPPASDPRCG